MPKEAGIHFELYRHLCNAIEKKPTYHGMHFGEVTPEKIVDSGRADIVVHDARNRPLIVIEAKREEPKGFHRNLDPYSPKVINQAFNYAARLGADYFATYNGSYLVLFRTYEKGVALLERKSRAYKVKDARIFAGEFLEQVAAIDVGKLGWEPDPKAFVNRLKVFHQRLADYMLTYFDHPSDDFMEDYNLWIEKQGWDLESQEHNSRFTGQASYLLMNKILFYKILEDTGHDVPDLDIRELSDPVKRRRGFKRITKAIDFEAIYQHDPVFDGIPLSSSAQLEIEEFVEELGKYDLNRFQFDTIGHIYEEIIPARERHDLGQYYTPPEVVDLIVKMTICSPTDRVLDPACGSGSFLVRAYNRLKELREENNMDTKHDVILSQIIGIDINRFPAHLSAINLALQDLKSETKEVNLAVDDFFSIEAGQDRIVTEKVSVRKPAHSRLYEALSSAVGGVDVIVGNPPYIRQEKIKNKETCRQHLKNIGHTDISERSDIYVYFFTHASEFLEDGERLGFITSNKWLTVGYGEDLQRFFLKNFKIIGIVSFVTRVFDVPLVPTCITILEKCSSIEDRQDHIVKFLSMRELMDINKVIHLLQKDIQAGILDEYSTHRLITLTQSELETADKWNRFMNAPTLYWDLLGHDKICLIEDVAEVSMGVKTGANDFFYLTPNDIKSWRIPHRFLKPVVKSIKQADSLEFSKEQTNLSIIDLSSFVDKKLKDLGDEMAPQDGLDEKSLPSSAKLKEITSDEIYILNEIRNEGYEGLYSYIIHSMWERDWGRSNPPQKRATCLQYRSRNKCWFNLGSLATPNLFAAKGYWERMPVPLNPDRAVIDCRLYEVHSGDAKLLAGILNSSLSRLFREVHGRITGGGMSEMMVYEMENMPILNPQSLTEKEASRIIDSLEKMINKGETQSPELDAAVLAPLGLEGEIKHVNEIVKAMSEARRKGNEIGLLLDGLDSKSRRVSKLKGAETISRGHQSKLTDF